MPDVARQLHPFEFRVFENVAGLKSLVQGDVDVFIDRRGNEKPAMIAIVGRQVGTATAQCDAQRAADDDHRIASW